MIRGGCSKNAIYMLQKLNFQCIIYQMKGIFFFYLLIHLNRKINAKKVIFNLYFSIVRISTNNVLGSLKLCMHLKKHPSRGNCVSDFF